MESIEELRKMDDAELIALGNGQYGRDYRHGSIADEIEREIAERYMELPLAADGVPIHVGDKMQYHGGEPFTVCAVAPGVIHAWAAVKLGERKTTDDYAPNRCTHYKPRTLEDVLQCAGVSVAVIEDVAAEIRELMEAGE